jgi:hypothetical protein
MLIARVQLDRIEELLAEFSRPQSEMRPLAFYQAHHLAILAMLRSVGHVLQKVDADTSQKKAWLADSWPRWTSEPIFSEFIELERNRLLKEFRGGIESGNPAIITTGAVADPFAPSGASLRVALDVGQLLAADGSRLLDRLRDAIDFWRRHLAEAEAAFADLCSARR